MRRIPACLLTASTFALAVPAAAGAQGEVPYSVTKPKISASGWVSTTVTVPYAGQYSQTILSRRTVLCRVSRRELSEGTHTVRCRARLSVLKKLRDRARGEVRTRAGGQISLVINTVFTTRGSDSATYPESGQPFFQ